MCHFVALTNKIHTHVTSQNCIFSLYMNNNVHQYCSIIISTPTKKIQLLKLNVLILGGLELASIDSVPPDLLDNAAILGAFSILTGLIFFMDLSAPDIRQTPKQTQTSPNLHLKPLDIKPEAYMLNGKNGNHKKETTINGHQNGGEKQKKTTFKTVTEKKPKHFDIYGHDKNGVDETDSVAELPVQMEKHSPIFSKFHRPFYGQYDNLSPSYLRFPTELESNLPSSPGEPGYVQYQAKKWGQQSQKTPKSSPTDI